MVLEALAEEVILGKPAVERGPRILNLNLVSAMMLLDSEVPPLWMFPDVGMQLSRRLEHDKADILCSGLVLRRASIVPCTRNEKRVRILIGQPHLPDGMVTNT